MSTFDMKAAIAAAKSKGPDMTKTNSGGGSYELPVEGFTRLRFVGYFETGKRESEWQGKKKVNDTAELVFELSGPKHPPREHEGTKYPLRATQRVKLSMNEKSNFVKLFTAMNYEKKATHIAELLGEAFVAEIKHNTVKINGNDVTFVNLENIRKPFGVDPESGDEYRIKVDPPLTEQKLFLWDFADAAMWDSLFIEGEYEEKKNEKGEVTSPAKSKNVIQNKIRTALNWKANPVYAYAEGSVTAADSAALDAAVGDAEQAGEPDDLSDIA